jgi:mannosyl-3-phosphoglycerate phosphatase
MLIVYTDLDGTLLDAATYTYAPAQPALGLLEERRIPLVFCTSKTRAEVEIWRERLANHHPFIVENGGALYIPEGYFPPPFQAPASRYGYAVIELGTRYPDLVEMLRQASAEAGCRVVGFNDLTAEALARMCDMPVAEAALAKSREYDEPFRIIDGPRDALLAAIVRRKGRLLRGGRFYHLVGANDKVHCVNLLTHFYQRAFGAVDTIGLGDALNDSAFLNAVDTPILLKSPDTDRLMAAVPRGRLIASSGPAGWNEAILSVLAAREEYRFERSSQAAPAASGAGR